MNLNEDLRFDNVPASVKRAFLRISEKIHLLPRAQLYKWTNRPLVGPSGISPWWSFVQNDKAPERDDG